MAQEFVTAKIKGDKVVVFQKPSCPYCVMAKDVLSKYKVKLGQLEFIDITGREDMGDIQDYLNKITGARTVSGSFQTVTWFITHSHSRTLHQYRRFEGVSQLPAAKWKRNAKKYVQLFPLSTFFLVKV